MIKAQKRRHFGRESVTSLLTYQPKDALAPHVHRAHTDAHGDHALFGFSAGFERSLAVNAHDTTGRQRATRDGIQICIDKIDCECIVRR